MYTYYLKTNYLKKLKHFYSIYFNKQCYITEFFCIIDSTMALLCSGLRGLESKCYVALPSWTFAYAEETLGRYYKLFHLLQLCSKMSIVSSRAPSL